MKVSLWDRDMSIFCLLESMPKNKLLYWLQSLRRPNGTVYLAAKKYYFGVGGGTREFRTMVENDGEF